MVPLQPDSGADPGFPVGGAPTLVGGGANFRHRHFSVKTYVKMKEFAPVGGGGGACRKLLYVDPPLRLQSDPLNLSEKNYIQILQRSKRALNKGSYAFNGFGHTITVDDFFEAAEAEPPRKKSIGG